MGTFLSLLYHENIGKLPFYLMGGYFNVDLTIHIIVYMHIHFKIKHSHLPVLLATYHNFAANVKTGMLFICVTRGGLMI